MPVNRNALIRYKTIDNCLRNPYRKWTLEDLIGACCDALYEFEGIDKGISKRTIQNDIQIMRSEKLGYNAPIIVYENKFYKYEDLDYSISQTPISEQDLQIMSGAVELLRQFKGFSYFTEMTDIVSRLEDHVTSAKQKSAPVIDFEKNENLKGLEHLDMIYQAIVEKKVLEISYRSFKASSENIVIFNSYLLKEYRNRWFVFGVNSKKLLLNLALDRIQNIEISTKISFIENSFFESSTFFDDLVGVTKQLNSQAEIVHFWVDKHNAPYIKTKPIHKSQTIVEEKEDGSMIFEINVVINRELHREFLGYADGIKVIFPRYLADFMYYKLKNAVKEYKK